MGQFQQIGKAMDTKKSDESQDHSNVVKFPENRRGLGPLDERRPGDAWHMAHLELKQARAERRAYRLQEAEIKLMSYRNYWLANVSCDTELSGTAKLTAMILWGSFLDKQKFYSNYRLEAYPTVRTLAEKIGRKKSTADRALKELEEHGWIGVERRGYDRDKNRRRPNRYRFLNYRDPLPNVSDLDISSVETVAGATAAG
jgi:hypothetical protein